MYYQRIPSYNMIPQFFVKSSGEQINFGRYDYVKGSTLIYDWGNPTSYNPAQGAGGITSNVNSGGEPQAQFKTGGGSAASMWTSNYTGTIQYNFSNGLNVEYNSSFPTGAMSIVCVYRRDEFQNGALVGLQNNNGINMVLSTGGVVTPTIWYGASGNTQATLSCTLSLGAGYNGWSVITFTTNGLNSYKMYLNDGTTNSTDNNTYNRGLFTPSAANIKLGKNALSNNYLNGVMMSYLVYPFELSTKQIKQNWYVFKPRLTQFP